MSPVLMCVTMCARRTLLPGSSTQLRFLMLTWTGVLSAAVHWPSKFASAATTVARVMSMPSTSQTPNGPNGPKQGTLAPALVVPTCAEFAPPWCVAESPTDPDGFQPALPFSKSPFLIGFGGMDGPTT